MYKIFHIVLISSLCLADELPTECIEPVVPMKFKNQNEYNSFNTAAEIYLSCIKKFADEQKAIASKHIDSSKHAYDQYNSFVNKTNASPAFTKSTSPKASSIQGSTGVPFGGSHNVGHSDPTKMMMNFGF